MKIICDSCGAKYSIADEKVQGKVFKIRCKKCSEVIVVKGTDGGVDGGDFGAAYGGGSGAAEWYVVIDGERDGPISPEEIEAYYTIGKLGPETFVWRDGLDDWVMLNTLNEFAHLTADSAGPEEATMIAARPETAASGFGAGAGAGMAMAGADALEDSTMVMDSGRFEASAFNEARADDFASGSHAAVESGSYPSMGSPAGAAVNGNNGSEAAGGYEGGSFDSFDEGGYEGGSYDDGGYDDGDQGGMFAAFDSSGADESYDSGGGIDFSAASSGPSLQSSSPSGGEANDLVGARNDNSVLFSLSSVDQVKAVSKPGDGQAQGNDKSGLIDIQALASTHAALKSGAASTDDEDDFIAGSMSVPAMMPMGSHKKSNNGLMIGIGILGLVVVLGLVVLVVILLTRDDTPQPQQQVLVAEQPAEEEEEEGLSAEEAAEAEAAAEAARAALEAAEEEEEEEEEEEVEEVARVERPRTQQGSTAPSAPRQQAPAPTSPSGGGGGGGGDILDRIGGGGGGGGTTAPAQQQQAAESSLPDSLSRSMVQNTIRRYNAQVRSCSQNNPEGVSGNAQIQFVVQGNGSVSSASAQGEFSGTTAGRCLEGVVRGMRFPETQDSNRTITYPFPVR